MDIEKKIAMTPKFRLSFPNLFVPTAMEEGQVKKYGCTMLFPKDVDLTALKKAAHFAAVEKWGDNKDNWPKTLKMPFKDGDEKEYDGYENCIYVAARNKKQPGMVDQRLQPIESEEEMYAGCYARAKLIAFAYDMTINKGVSFALQTMQKLAEGEPFGASRNAADDFDAIEDNTANTEEKEDWL